MRTQEIHELIEGVLPIFHAAYPANMEIGRALRTRDADALDRLLESATQEAESAPTPARRALCWRAVEVVVAAGLALSSQPDCAEIVSACTAAIS